MNQSTQLEVMSKFLPTLYGVAHHARSRHERYSFILHFSHRAIRGMTVRLERQFDSEFSSVFSY